VQFHGMHAGEGAVVEGTLYRPVDQHGQVIDLLVASMISEVNVWTQR
jgi:hypothetical protein